MITRIFLSPDDLRPDKLRLRAGWRLLAQFNLMVVIAMGVAIIFNIFEEIISTASLFGLLAAQISTFIAINLSILLARLFLDRRSVVSLGLQMGSRATWDLIIGFFISGAMMLLIYLITAIGGWLDFRGLAWQRISIPETILFTLVMLVVFIIVGWQEELLFRGYQLQNMAEGLNLIWAIIISSLFFALGHLSNPSMNWMALVGLFLAGIYMAYAFIRTRRLWLPIGLHVGWNFFEGTVFGFPVSGLGLFGLFEHTITGPSLITGGAFGPEAGLVLLPALAFGTILVYYYTSMKTT